MINSETKINKIEGLSKEHFIGMMNNLLIKMSYKEIKNEAGYFLGLFASPISSDWHGFIPFIEKLSGKEIGSIDSFPRYRPNTLLFKKLIK